MAELRPAGYIGRPASSRSSSEGRRAGVPLPSVTKALVSGEAFPPSLRDWFAERGIAQDQCYATAEGPIVMNLGPRRPGAG